MKFLIALRYLGFAVAALTIVLPWLCPALPAGLVKFARRIALALGLGAQLALTTANVARGRSPWTKLVFPVLGIFVALETGFTAAFPVWAIALVAGCELIVVGVAIARALRVAGRAAHEYPEVVLAAEFARLVDGRVARYLALEMMLVAAAARYLTGGFLRAAPRGFSYVVQSDVGLLLALPPFVILPEMIVVDLLIPPAYWPIRVVSDLLHLYAIAWAVGAYALFRARPHRIDQERARFSCGILASFEIERSAIASACISPGGFDARAWKRANARDGAALTVIGAPVVLVELTEPRPFAGWFGTRQVRRLAISADRPRELVRALASA